MDKRKTGGSGLSRKILAMLFCFSAVAFGADNSIYIDQSGDNSTITITQEGAGNTVRGLPGTGTSNVTPATISGDNNTVVIDQIGSGNMLKFGIATTTGGTGMPSIRYSVTGNNADATIKSMNPGSVADSPIIDVQQIGNFAFLSIDQRGMGPNNTITALQNGGNNNSLTVDQNSDVQSTATINQTGGGGNTTTINQSGGANSATVTTVGATNTTTIVQAGSHTSVVDITGSGNNTLIDQSGVAGSNIANYKAVGSGNTTSITQRN